MNTDTIGTATYSPEDNKLRLYPFSRLSREDYDRVKAAGFSWAPKQQLFVAPIWTPAREDLLIELCGEIGDEDKSLVERSEERAARMENYSERRAADAEAAHKAVSAIADNIPFGQPILVGHHSERHARRDAEKIENGMRRAVKMWEESKYWTDRAAGAIHAAKYKERPDVRARRIKGLEAEERKQQKERAHAGFCLRFWRGEMKLKAGGFLEVTMGRALDFANRFDQSYFYHSADGMKWVDLGDALQGRYLPDGVTPPTLDQVKAKAIENREKQIAYADRWLCHLANRLTYERAMLADSGGTVADRTRPEAGGACRCWCSPGYGAGWSKIHKVNKVSVTLLDNWGNGGRDFTRTIPFDKLKAVMTRAQVDEVRTAGRLQGEDTRGFYCDREAETRDEAMERSHREHLAAAAPKPDAAPFEAMKESLRAGVQVVTAPQLFPTPHDLAHRMADLADLQPGQRVLEPSAGTGNLLNGITVAPLSIVAVELSVSLADRLRQTQGSKVEVRQGDFLELNGELGTFDRILMNPPFANGADIKHILHARDLLKPGGRLVAICGGGPRQAEQLQPLADSWEELPADTFKEQGAGVRAVLLTMTP